MDTKRIVWHERMNSAWLILICAFVVIDPAWRKMAWNYIDCIKFLTNLKNIVIPTVDVHTQYDMDNSEVLAGDSPEQQYVEQLLK